MKSFLNARTCAQVQALFTGDAAAEQAHTNCTDTEITTNSTNWANSTVITESQTSTAAVVRVTNVAMGDVSIHVDLVNGSWKISQFGGKARVASPAP